MAHGDPEDLELRRPLSFIGSRDDDEIIRPRGLTPDRLATRAGMLRDLAIITQARTRYYQPALTRACHESLIPGGAEPDARSPLPCGKAIAYAEQGRTIG